MSRLPTALLLTLLVVLGCSSDDTGQEPPDDQRELVLIDPSAPDVGLKPGYSEHLSLQYRTVEGGSIAGQIVTFAIVGDAKGSTLSADAVQTGGDGIAIVQLHAGSAETSFSVHASATNAPSKVIYIEISNVGFGSLNASSSYAGQLPQGGEPVAVDYLLFDGMGCAERPPHAPPEAARNLTEAAPAIPVRFGALRVGQSRGLLALGFDAERRLRAAGCIDLPADLIRRGGNVTLEVVLTDLHPRVMGHYDLTTDLKLDSAAGPIGTALAPWKEISDCPYDPAQRLLDCALDALDEGDPLDCEAEGPSALAQTLAQQRGMIQPDGCRSDLTSTSETSIEAELAAAMRANDTDGLLQALALTHDDAAALLGHLRLRTRLSLSELAAPGPQNTLSASHRVIRIAFVGGGESTVEYEARRVALPVPLSTGIAASLDGWRLEIGRHELGVRFAMMARQALTDGVLAAAHLPEDPAEMLQDLANLITTPGTDPGCPALSKTICGRAGQPEDCLRAGCEAGLSALAGQLDEGFATLDSTAADLSLAGNAQMLDETGDLQPDALSGEDSEPAVWTEAKLVLGPQHAELNALKATFTGSPSSD